MEIIDYKPDLHVFVCVNDRTSIDGNVKPSCGPRMNNVEVNELKVWARQLVKKVQVTKVKCLGLCHSEGAVMCIYPKGKFYKRITTIDEIKDIIKEELS